MIVNFHAGDTLELKKKHPCKSSLFSVLFCGSDVKIKCQGCGREMVLPRIQLEKNIKRVIPGEQNDR